MHIDRSDDILLAHRLADAAGHAIRPFFRARYGLERKDDASPVTEADRAAELVMREILEDARPDDGIFGEEYGRAREGADRVWVLDPIDGTRSFVAGRPIFGTLIALVEGGIPVIGVLDQPILGERWVGEVNQPTIFNGGGIATRACGHLADATLATTGPSYFQPAEWEAYNRCTAGARDVLWGGDCYNYGLLSLGHLDAVIESGLKLYDFAALVPIVEGAGGRMRDWQGRHLNAASSGHVVAVGDERLLAPIVERLAG
jgi:inositol-phosphate phosphatase / L-galactose 1-phosphate phosphatase / histidinol-phosphatase